MKRQSMAFESHPDIAYVVGEGALCMYIFEAQQTAGRISFEIQLKVRCQSSSLSKTLWNQLGSFRLVLKIAHRIDQLEGTAFRPVLEGGKYHAQSFGCGVGSGLNPGRPP
jgi:hypothetical protein